MDRLGAVYRVRAASADVERRAQALAVEQSVEMPLDAVRQPRILDEVVARVAAVEPIGPELFSVRLDLATLTVGGDLAQLLNMAFGNCSLQPDVELIDLDLEPAVLAHLTGPRLGIEGLRALTGATHRPLTCTALKPQGLSPDELAHLAATFARGGVDLVKDDHGLADQASAPFARRVAACQAAVAAANRAVGGTTRYAPSLVGGPRRLASQARIAREEGVEVVLVAPMLVGLPAFAELVDHDLGGLGVLAHPALSGGRMAPALVSGKLFRLAGADAAIFPHHGGRFSYTPADCEAMSGHLRRSWGGLRAALPVPAGGMTTERIEEMIGEYGPDVMLLVGGALLQAGDDLEAATRAFVQRVAAAGAAQTTAPVTPAMEPA
jgi:ribulose-bisphosphate carboxylase large chain